MTPAISFLGWSFFTTSACTTPRSIMVLAKRFCTVNRLTALSTQGATTKNANSAMMAWKMKIINPSLSKNLSSYYYN